MIYVFDIHEQAVNFKNSLKYFSEDTTLDLGVVTINKCRELLLGYIYGYVAEKSLWLTHEKNELEHGSYIFNTNSGFAKKVTLSLKGLPIELIKHEEIVVKAKARLFPFYLETISGGPMRPADRMMEDIETTIITPHTDSIFNLLDQIIPDQTWDIWHVQEAGKNLQFIKGMDYRAWDWERRFKNSELTDVESDYVCDSNP